MADVDDDVDSVPVPRRDSLVSEMAVVGRPSIGSKGNSRTPTPVKNSFLDCNPVAFSASRSLRPASSRCRLQHLFQ